MTGGGVGGWYENREASPGICSPARKVTRRSTEEPGVDEQMRQVDATLIDTQAQTQTTSRKIWVDFADAARTLPGHARVGGGGDEGWVRSKRGRDGCTEVAGGSKTQPRVTEPPSHTNLNLNLSPGMVHVGDDMWGTGGIVVTSMGGGEGRGGGRGSGRGCGRVRRPPPIQPRYRSSASVETLDHAIRCSGGVSYCACGCVTLLNFCYRCEVDSHVIEWSQELLRVGATCWVLHPSNGIRPVAEGIAGPAPPKCTTESGIGRSLLRELLEEGQQTVIVTKLHKKNTELMFPEANSGSKYLDDYVTPTASSSFTVTWDTRYLAEREEQA